LRLTILRLWNTSSSESSVIPPLVDLTATKPAASQRHPDPRGDHERQGEPVRNDDLVWARADQNQVHRAVDTLGELAPGFGAGDPVPVVHPVADLRGWTKRSSSQDWGRPSASPYDISRRSPFVWMGTWTRRAMATAVWYARLRSDE
jgi:hypothetical protein